MNLSAIVCLYLARKRSLGHRFQGEGFVLRAFCKAVGDGPMASIESESVRAFLDGNGPVTDYWAKKYRVLSGLYRFARARGFASGSPLPRSIPRPAVPAFVPYVYSHAEIKRLLDAVPAACTARTLIDAYVFRAVLLLLYGAGLRISEALSLTVGDVDLPQAMLRIRETKFHKTRIVPLGGDLTRTLIEYTAKRNASHGTLPEAPFLCLRNGTPLSKSAAQGAFRRLRAHAGVRREGGARRQPRLHDLRHNSESRIIPSSHAKQMKLAVNLGVRVAIGSA